MLGWACAFVLVPLLSFALKMQFSHPCLQPLGTNTTIALESIPSHHRGASQLQMQLTSFHKATNQTRSMRVASTRSVLSRGKRALRHQRDNQQLLDRDGMRYQKKGNCLLSSIECTIQTREGMRLRCTGPWESKGVENSCPGSTKQGSLERIAAKIRNTRWLPMAVGTKGKCL